MVSSGAAQLMQRTGDGRRKDELVFISPKCYIACVNHSVFKPWGLKRICKHTQLVARHTGSPGGVLCRTGAVPSHVSLCHERDLDETGADYYAKYPIEIVLKQAGEW